MATDGHFLICTLPAVWTEELSPHENGEKFAL